MLETPFEAGLGAFVRFDKGPFIGREALRERVERDGPGSARRLATILIGGSDYLPVFGGEAIRIEGTVVGRVRSTAYGPNLSRTIASVYLRSGLPEGTALEVDVFGERIPGIIAADVLVDPAGQRMRG
jgi:glycine cleavage system aminomethyltransferase T